MIEVVVEGLETVLVEKIKRAREQDNKVIKVVEEIKKAEVKASRILQNELLTYLWYLNLGYTFRGLEVIQKFNNDDNDD